MELNKKLAEIQAKLKAPKGQKNTFGNYKYRSCEDIMESVKPLLDGLTLTISDEVVVLGDIGENRFYVKATVRLSNGKDEIVTTAFARESLVKKGMDEAQITGAASSYSRKYALNGMFAIDDTKDPDSTNDHGKGPSEKAKAYSANKKSAPKKDTPEKPARRRTRTKAEETKPKTETKDTSGDDW